MLEIKKIKTALLAVGCLSIVFGYFILGFNYTKAELTPGNVKLDKGSSQKFTDYLLSQPIIPGPFTGGKEADMNEILPFYTSPLTKFNLSVSSIQNKQSFKTGENLDLNGKISYAYDPKETQKAVDNLKDCQNCPASEVYLFPQISNVGVFVQVWRKDQDKNLSKKGDYLVDEYYATQNLNLIENKTEDFNIKWKIPEELKSGNYYLFFFVNSNNRFSLVGSPLVAFDQALVYDFTIQNDIAGNGLELDKNAITINSKDYVYRQPAPEITPENAKINIEIPLSNLGSESKNAKITYNLYGWGQEDPSDLVDSKQESKTIGSGEKSTLEYSFSPSATGSVYDLEIKATDANSSSTANIRFVVKGINRGIIRYLGQAENSQNQDLPVFCLRNAAWNNMFHGKVKITALAENGQIIHSFEKEGSMKPEDHCFVIKDASWLKEGKTTKLKGEIYDDNGRLVDQKQVNLVSKVEQPKNTSASQVVQEKLPIDKLQIILVVLLIVCLIIGGYLISIRSKKEE